MKSEQVQSFIKLRAIDGKSPLTIAQELNCELSQVKDWEKKYRQDIMELKADAYDKIVEVNKLNSVERFQYLAELYKRMQKELDKRDFSGLPTDKLYYIQNDVYELLLELKIEAEK